MDIVKTENLLYLNQKFADGDTRLFSLPNPRLDLTVNDIRDLESYMKTNQPTIGDKTSANFTGFKSAYSKNNSKITLDLGL